jgi:nitrile hydratase
MNGVFDLGGTDGMGRVLDDKGTEPVFRADWEKIAFATFASCARAGLFGVDEFRHSIEKMDPVDYLSSNYYEHWTHVAEDRAIEQGLFTHEDIEQRTKHYLENPGAPLPERDDPELVEFMGWAQANGFDASRESDKQARFKVGDEVFIATDSPVGHTRRARYTRGKTGVITAAHGTWIYPDSAGNGNGDAPEHLYTVKFSAMELWGAATAEPNQVVYVDVFEPYMTLVKTAALQGA